MKTTKKAEITAVNAEFLEDIIFEGRNQNYGAYQLRKSYNTHLNLSLIIVLSFAVAVISLAFIHSIMNPVIPAIKEPEKIIKIDLSQTIIPETPELPEQKAKNTAIAPVLKTDGPPEVVENVDDNMDPPMIADDQIQNTGAVDIPDVITVIEPPVNNPPVDVDKTFDMTQVTSQALFGGGSVENFRKWLSKHIDYPEDAIRSDLNGKVLLQFTVDKTGEIIDIKVIRGLHPAIDQAAVQALKRSPKWTAATINGKPVKVSYFLPISFNILN